MFAWQATVQDEFGNAVVSPVVTVYESDGVTLAEIYNAAGVAIANPFTGSLEGFAQFWANSGDYRIVGTSGPNSTQTWAIQLGSGTELPNVIKLSDFLSKSDLAAITLGDTAGQSATNVTAAIREFHEAVIAAAYAVDGAQVVGEYVPGILRINGRLMSDAFHASNWNVSSRTRSRITFSVNGTVRFRIQGWADGRAGMRTVGPYAGSTYIAPYAVWEWFQDVGRQNLAGFEGSFAIEGANNTATDPIGWYFYRLNATRFQGSLECNNLRNRNFVFVSTFNSKAEYVRSAASAGYSLTEAGGSGLLPSDTVTNVSGDTIRTGVRYTISGTTLTLQTMVRNETDDVIVSQDPFSVFTADHVGKWVGLDRQGRQNVLGDDSDGGNEGGSTRRSARWFEIASVTDGSTVELSIAPEYQTTVGQWVIQNRCITFGALLCSVTAGVPAATLSIPITDSLVGLEVVIPGAGYDGGPTTLPNLVAMITAHSGNSITLSHAPRVSKSSIPFMTSSQVHVGSLSHTAMLASSRKTDDFHIDRLWCESGPAPAVPLFVQNSTNFTIGNDSKLHGSPQSSANWGANFACIVAGEFGGRFEGRLTHSRHSRQFGMIYLTGDRAEWYFDGELSSWTADDQTSIFYIDPANISSTRIWDVFFNAADYATGFPDTAAGQVFERGGANYTFGRVKAGAGQRSPRGERPSWPTAPMPPTRAPAFGSTNSDALIAQSRGGFIGEDGVTYQVGPNQFLGVASGSGTEGFNTLKGYKPPKVKLVFGQSNTAGNGTGGELRLNPRVRIFNTDASVPALGTAFNRAEFGASGSIPINKTSGGLPVNNALAHAASNLADDLDQDVYVIMVARGGVPLESFLTDAILTANGWSRGAWPDLSGLMLDSLAAALPQVPGEPTQVDLISTITGEANRADAPTVFAAKFMAIITMLSDAGYVDMDTVRVVAGEISVNAHTRYYENHKAALAEIDAAYGSTTLPGFVSVSSVGVDVNVGDETHYSGPGLVEYGRRIANAALGPTIRSAIGATRANAVAACARGWRAGDGLPYTIGGLDYLGRAGSTNIPDLPGLVPVDPTPFHYGLSADGVTDIGWAVNAGFSVADVFTIPEIVGSAWAVTTPILIGTRKKLTGTNAKRSRLRDLTNGATPLITYADYLTPTAAGPERAEIADLWIDELSVPSRPTHWTIDMANSLAVHIHGVTINSATTKTITDNYGILVGTRPGSGYTGDAWLARIHGNTLLQSKLFINTSDSEVSGNALYGYFCDYAVRLGGGRIAGAMKFMGNAVGPGFTQGGIWLDAPDGQPILETLIIGNHFDGNNTHPTTWAIYGGSAQVVQSSTIAGNTGWNYGEEWLRIENSISNVVADNNLRAGDAFGLGKADIFVRGAGNTVGPNTIHRTISFIKPSPGGVRSTLAIAPIIVEDTDAQQPNTLNPHNIHAAAVGVYQSRSTRVATNPTPERRIALFDDFLSPDGLNKFPSLKGSNGVAAVAALESGNNGLARLQFGTDAGGTMALNGSQMLSPAVFRCTDWGLQMDAIVRPSGAAFQKWFVGFTKGTGLHLPITESGGVYTTNVTDAVGFLYSAQDPGAGVALVGIGVRNGVLTAPVSLPIVAAAQFLRLRLELGNGGRCTFLVNGTPYGHMTANAITGTVLTGVYAGGHSTNTGNKWLTVDYLGAEKTRGYLT